MERFDDLPPDTFASAHAARESARADAIGDVPPEVSQAFFLLSGSMIHDIYSLRVMLGSPSEVISTEVWSNGRGVSIVLGYPNGARCIATWVDLPDLWDFKETLEIYGDKKRVMVSYPTGFSRGILSEDGTWHRCGWHNLQQNTCYRMGECICSGTATFSCMYHGR